MVHTNVMHLIDSLDAGGSERVAVNLVNLMPREQYKIHLCTTRHEGPLETLIAADVGRLRLKREWRFDPKAQHRLSIYLQKHQIQILHAHSTSLLLAVVASFWPPFPKIIWHDHYGRYATEPRAILPYKLLMKRVDHIFAVNQSLVEWSKQHLKMSEHKVSYLSNFVSIDNSQERVENLPGKPGKRIVCVANLRPEKDHITLIRAMELIINHDKDAHLILVGNGNNLNYLNQIRQEITKCGLESHISLLGLRQDVSSILRTCDIGVLSSASEGLPLALLEYGATGLPAVATQVGQCIDVLNNGNVGLLVPPATPDQLADALMSLLCSLEQRVYWGQKFRNYVQEHYSSQITLRRLCQIYTQILT